MAEVGRQIVRPDEHAVDAIDLADFIEVVERDPGFSLHQHANFTIRLFEVVLDPAVLRCTRAARHAAHTFGWETGGGDRCCRFFGILHIGQQQRLGAGIEIPFDQHQIVPGRAHYCLCSAAFVLHCHQLHADVGRVVRAMLGVEQHPVKAGRRTGFNYLRRPVAHPQADLRFPRENVFLEVIDGQFQLTLLVEK